MALSDLTRESVQAALDQFRNLGRDAFLERYGFGKALSYFVLHEGLRYDSKAIAGAAHGFLTGMAPLGADDFSGGEDTVAKRLRELGFEVTGRAESSAAVPNFWVEISALDHGHGGPGWELGDCLWSPSEDRSGNDRYAIMRSPKRGDVVYHLIRRDGDRALVGHSRVSGRATIVKKPPSQPGQWAGFPGYFRIPLEGFTAFNPAPSLREIEAAHTDEIREDITPVRPEHHPYATYGEGIRIAQGLYLAALTNRMIAIFGAYAGALPDETGLAPVSIDTRQYQEGEQLRRERVFFARNPKLREDAIKHHGARCLVCEFDFEATYGAIGEGFIEIHHLEPVSARGKANATGWSTSVEDVRPLCSNCHRMVHRRSPPIPVDELAALIRLRRAQTSSEKKAAN